MKKHTSRIPALLLPLLTLILAGCSSVRCASCGKAVSGSGYDVSTLGRVCADCYTRLTGLRPAASSNTGAWIAFLILLFVIVFAAASGIVYLVVRMKLQDQPVRRPAAASSRKVSPTTAERYSRQGTAEPRPQADSWVCPNDRTRNTGRVCQFCGAVRPVPRPDSRRPAAPEQSRPREQTPPVRSQPFVVPDTDEPTPSREEREEAFRRPAPEIVREATVTNNIVFVQPQVPREEPIRVVIPPIPEEYAEIPETPDAPPAVPEPPVTPSPLPPAPKKGFRTAYSAPGDSGSKEN